MTGEAAERPLDVGREIVDVLARERTEPAGRAIRTVQRFFSRADTAVLRRRDLKRFADWDADEREVAKEHWIETWAVDGRATVRELSQFRALVEVDEWSERRDRLVRGLHREILHNDDPLIRKALREIRDSVRKRQVPLLYPSGRPYGSRRGVQMLSRRQLELESSILEISTGSASESRIQTAEELADLRSVQVFESERTLDPGRFISENEVSGGYVGRPGPMTRSLDGGRVDSFEVMVCRGRAELDRFERRLLADPGFEAAIEPGWDLVREVTTGLRQNEHRAWLNWPFPSEMEPLYPDETATARSAVAQVARAEVSEASRNWAVDSFKRLKKGLDSIQERANVLEHWALHRAAKVQIRAPPLSVVPSNLPVRAAKWAAGLVRHIERRVEAERSRSV